MTIKVGEIEALFRYPVYSLDGERLVVGSWLVVVTREGTTTTNY